MKHLVIGVLALQGAFAKHVKMLQSLGVEAIEVRKPEQLAACDGLIIPGGESTTMMKQMQFIHFIEPLKQFGKEKPLFGTCAGLILMSKEIVSDQMSPFGFLDISVERNAFGRQVESFKAEVKVELSSGKPHPFQAVFIRAPRIRKWEPTVQVLAEYEGEPILVQQGKHLGATFHPELTGDSSIHAYFISSAGTSSR